MKKITGCENLCEIHFIKSSTVDEIILSFTKSKNIFSLKIDNFTKWIKQIPTLFYQSHIGCLLYSFVVESINIRNSTFKSLTE